MKTASKVLALALLAALQVSALGSARAAELQSIGIGIADADNAAQPIYADELGFFGKNGIAANITLGVSGDDVLSGLRSGSLDVGFVNVVSIAGALQRGERLVVLAGGALYNSAAPITVLVQGNGANFRTGKDLDGATVDTPALNDLGQLGVEAWVDANGGDAKSVHFVHGLAMSDLLSDLGTPRLAAAEVNEPSWTMQRKSGSIKLLANTFDAIAPTFLIGAYVATKAWVSAHPDAARGFTAAMRTAAQWGNAHHPESAMIVAKRFSVDPAIASSMVRATYADGVTPAIVQPVLDAAAKYGLIRPMRADALMGT